MSAPVQFSIGQIIHHKIFDYDGVIFEVDPYFMLTEEWYQLMARSKPNKNAPWYHVLVNNSKHTTYVAQQNLTATTAVTSINHPRITQFFDSVKQGKYQLKKNQLQ